MLKLLGSNSMLKSSNNTNQSIFALITVKRVLFRANELLKKLQEGVSSSTTGEKNIRIKRAVYSSALQKFSSAHKFTNGIFHQAFYSGIAFFSDSFTEQKVCSTPTSSEIKLCGAAAGYYEHQDSRCDTHLR